MAAKGEVDLVIRAKNEASKNVDAINKSLKNLSDQQKIVGDSATTADDKLSRLGLELARLRTNAQNLKSLTTVGEVLDKATAAMERQRVAAAEASGEYDRLSTRQKDLAAETARAAAAAKEATAEFRQQSTALKDAKSSLSDLSKEATSLANQEKALERSIGSTSTALDKRKLALDEAAAKQEKLSQAIANSDKVTKAQQNSLDAANRSLDRRRAAVDETVAKEAALRAQLASVQAAQTANAAATDKATAAVTEQAAKVSNSKAAADGLKVSAESLAKAQRAIVTDVGAASAAVDKQATDLKAVESEYAQVQAAATAARTAIAGSATASKDAGAEAGRAAVQVATFAARLAVLAGASGGKTSSSLGIDPAAIKEAEAALSSIDSRIKRATDDATSATVSAKEMSTALQGIGKAKATLEGVQSALGSQAAAVDGANTAWKTAEAEVRRLAIAIKEADAPSEALATAFGKAQGAARLAKDEFLRQTAAADRIAGSMQSAGIGTGTLSSATAALTPKVQQASALMNQAQDAATRMGAGVRAAGNDADGAKPKVSGLAIALGSMVAAANRAAGATNPLRAFRSELVSLIAASAGIYAIKEQLTSLWEAGTNLASNKMKFATAFDGVEAGGKELAYAREVAINLKLPMDTLTKSYADLALAAKGTSMEGEGARKVFVAFAQTARVNGSSAESLGGTYVALTQIMSKGKVQAEELRQQLGDRLPGAMQLMAEGLGVTTEKLDEMMGKGQLTREALLNMAAAASSRVGPQLAAALDSPAAKLADFQNRLLVFKETIAGSGFLDAVAGAFERLAQALSTPEAIQAAKDLGVALGDIVTWATSLATSGNLDTILSWMKGLGAAWVALQITSIITGLYGFATAIGATTIAALGLDVALAPILVGLAALAAVVATVAGAFLAWKLVEWVYDNVPAFAEGVLKIKNAALSAWDGILQFWEMTALKLKNSFTKLTAQLADIWYGMLDKILNSFPDLTKALGMGDFGADIAKRAAEAAANLQANEENLQKGLNDIRDKYAGVEGQRQKELQDDIAGYYTARIKKEEAATPTTGTKPTATPTSTVGTELVTAPAYVPSTAKADEAAAKKAAAARISLEKSVANEMFTIRAQLEKKSAETTDQAMAAVPAKYAALYGKLTALGKDRNSEEWKTVDALVAQEQQAIKELAAKKAATAEAKATREATTAENKSRKDAMTEVNALMQTRKNLQDQIAQAEARGDTTGVEALKVNLATVTTQATEAINGMMAFWQSVGGPQADAAIAKLQAMSLQITKTKTEAEKFQNKAGEMFGSKLMSGVDSFVTKLAETGDVFQSAKEAFLDFARSFLIEIAQMILKQMLFNAIKVGLRSIGGGGAIGAGVLAGVSAASNHSGGVVGRDSGPAKTLSLSTVRNAVRYHGGGVAGLKSNEVPTVLEAGEVVRTQQQEKALADKMDAGGGAAAPQPLNIINTIDTESFFQAAGASPAFEKTVLNLIRVNKSTIKSTIG